MPFDIPDALAPPVKCDHCQSVHIEFLDMNDLNWRQLSEWPFIWFCHTCRACVGTHKETNLPLGTMADSDTRRLRARAHFIFDPIWREGLLSRTDAYTYLAQALRLEREQCHIGLMNQVQLLLTIAWSKSFTRDNAKIILRRKAKTKDANVKRSERTKSKIIARKSNIRSGRRG